MLLIARILDYLCLQLLSVFFGKPTKLEMLRFVRCLKSKDLLSNASDW